MGVCLVAERCESSLTDITFSGKWETRFCLRVRMGEEAIKVWRPRKRCERSPRLERMAVVLSQDCPLEPTAEL